MRREEARDIIRQRVSCAEYLKKAKSGNYCCPFCHSGEGENKSGALKLYNTNTWTCHACGKSGDVFDLCQVVNSTDYNGALFLLAQAAGITIDGRSEREYPLPPKAAAARRDKIAQEAARMENNGFFSASGINTPFEPESGKAAVMEPEEVQPEADYTAYYEECRKRLMFSAEDSPEVLYLAGRGISQELATAHGLGFDPKADPASAPGAMGAAYRPHPCPRIIIPTTKSHYVGRSIDKNTPKDLDKLNPPRKKGAGSPGIFNASAMELDKPVFVVEGAFDALSIIAAGYDAMATNSAVNLDKLAPEASRRGAKALFVLCPDNDRDETTRARVWDKNAAAEQKLQAAGFLAGLADICCGYKDANEALTGNPEAFREQLANIYAIAQEMRESPSEATESILEGSGGENIAGMNETGNKAATEAEGGQTQAAAAGLSLNGTQTAKEEPPQKAVEGAEMADKERGDKIPAGNAKTAGNGAEGAKMARPHNVAYYINNFMGQDISRYSREIKTGYYNLDAAAGGGLYPGLYVIAAISSLGKTTFAHQMADQIAASGQEVIFFSLEMSRLEMVSKSIAREMAIKDTATAVSSLAIKRGKYDSATRQRVTEAAAAYRDKVGENLSIVEGSGLCEKAPDGSILKDEQGRPKARPCTVSAIRDYVREYMRVNRCYPVVFVDYLQIMSPSIKAGTKENIDFTITELRQIARDFRITIIVISSLNRANYLMPVSFESLKESGSIEYSADVIFGLDLSILDNELFEKEGKAKQKRELIETASLANPRAIKLHALKNRNGRKNFACYFSYYPANDLFIPDEEKSAGGRGR